MWNNGKKTLILIVIAVIALILFAACRGTNPSGDIRDAKRIATKSDLSRLLGNVDFADIEIVDIKVVGGTVYVFCEGPDDAGERKRNFVR